MADKVTIAKQTALFNEHNVLYKEYAANLNAARLQDAKKSRKALDAVEEDILENTLDMPLSENSGYLELKSKLERVPTAEAQEDHTKAQMDASKLQFWALLIVAGVMIAAAVRLIVFTSTPSVKEVAVIFIALGCVAWFFS